jgi:hypothetical protein
MTSAGDNLIASTARALLRERIEATPWFRIKMTEEQRRAAIEREVDAYWHLFIADAAERLLGLGEASPHSRHEFERSGQRKSAHKGALRRCRPWGQKRPVVRTNVLAPLWFHQDRFFSSGSPRLRTGPAVPLRARPRLVIALLVSVSEGNLCQLRISPATSPRHSAWSMKPTARRA